MKVRRIDFSPTEWIAEQERVGHMIAALGNGFGDYVLTRNEWQELRRAVLARDAHRCVYCGNPATSADHVLPRIQGGLTVERNLVAACGPCNSRKGGRL